MYSIGTSNDECERIISFVLGNALHGSPFFSFFVAAFMLAYRCIMWNECIIRMRYDNRIFHETEIWRLYFWIDRRSLRRISMSEMRMGTFDAVHGTIDSFTFQAVSCVCDCCKIGVPHFVIHGSSLFMRTKNNFSLSRSWASIRTKKIRTHVNFILEFG